jgi:preprotein translocase subunit SecA
MATNFLTKIFGSRNDRLLKQYRKTVERINAMESQFEALTDEQPCASKTLELKGRVSAGETLDNPCCPRLLRWCAKAPSAS